MPEKKPHPVASFWRDYRQPVFFHWDAMIGYGATALAVAALSATEGARSRLYDITLPGITMAALGLTFSLAAMSFLSGIIDQRIVRVLDEMERREGNRSFGLHGLLVAFKSVAVLGALAVIFWFALRLTSATEVSDSGATTSVLKGNAWDTVHVVLGALAIGTTVWLIGAIVSLVGVVATLISGKANLIRMHELNPGAKADESRRVRAERNLA